ILLGCVRDFFYRLNASVQRRVRCNGGLGVASAARGGNVALRVGSTILNASGSRWSQAIDKSETRLLRRKPQGCKISSDNRNSGEPARLDRFAVIRFR